MRRSFKTEYLYNIILASALLAVMIVVCHITTAPKQEPPASVVYATATDATPDTIIDPGSGDPGGESSTGTIGDQGNGSTGVLDTGSDGNTGDGTISDGNDTGNTDSTGIDEDIPVIPDPTDSDVSNEQSSTESNSSDTTTSTTDGDGSESEADISQAETTFSMSGMNAAELAQLTTEYGDTLKEKNDLTAKLNEIMNSQNDFITRLHDLDDMIIEYQDKIDELNVKVSEARELLYNMQVSVDEAEEKQQEQYEIVKAHIKEEYENGKYTYLDALFSAVDYLDIVNKAEYIQSIEAYDQGLLSDYTNEKQSLVDKRAVLMAVSTDMDLLEEAYQNKQDSLQILSAEKEVQINSYQDSIDNLKADISYLESKEAEQSARIAALEASSNVTFTISGNSNYTYNGEQFVWPMPTSTTITSGFGYRTAPTAGATSEHRGIDIACPMGSAVHAAASGIVIYTGYLGSAGNAVVIDHGSGISTCYYHLSSFACSVGDSIAANQVIAYSGSTGVSTGPHLHFAVRENGTYVNPLNYFTSMSNDQSVSNSEGN